MRSRDRARPVPSRMKRSSEASVKNPDGRSRSARARTSGRLPAAPRITCLPSAHMSRPKREATRKRVGVEEDTASHVQRVVEVLVVDLVDLARANAAGQQGGHHRPGAAAHVDVEGRLPAGQPLLEGGQGADLVHPANDAPARQRQRVAGARPLLPEAHGAMYDLHLISWKARALPRHASAEPAGKIHRRCLVIGKTAGEPD